MHDICGNCGHQLEIHYNWFCPKCETEAMVIGKKKVYDLFKLMCHMEANGFISKDKYWSEYVLESYNIRNDIYIDAYFGEGTDDEINKYHEYVRGLLGIEEDESVIMRVSW